MVENPITDHNQFNSSIVYIFTRSSATHFRRRLSKFKRKFRNPKSAFDDETGFETLIQFNSI